LQHIVFDRNDQKRRGKEKRKREEEKERTATEKKPFIFPPFLPVLLLTGSKDQ